MAFEMMPLPYAFDALETTIDAQTVELHYGKHHAAYLKNLNTALEKYPQFFDLKIEQILGDLDSIPDDIRAAVRNNAGGYYNHNIYWAIMGPHRGGEPSGRLAAAINAAFGSFSSFKEQLEKAGMGRFGSGWAWLSKKSDGGLMVHSTPNQDTPLADGLFPVIGVDVWEHAYYLKYQNRRAEYLSNWWNLVNWDEAEQRFVEGR